MKTLFEGIKNFRQQYFQKHRELFHELENSQQPHSLFITCSDSRVLPDIITTSVPGELFIIRNIANMVPKYSDKDAFLSVPSGLEYGVEKLNVQNIIVCGHSNCGGIASLMNPDISVMNLKFTRKWLELGNEVKIKAMKLHDEDKTQKLAEIAEKMNIIEQMEHLMTYPFISRNVYLNKLKIYGWYYRIDTGEVFNYNKDNGKFEIIE